MDGRGWKVSGVGNPANSTNGIGGKPGYSILSTQPII